MNWILVYFVILNIMGLRNYWRKPLRMGMIICFELPIIWGIVN